MNKPSTLSASQRRILSLVELLPERPAKEVARLARTTSHKVAYTLRRLRDDKIISRRMIVNFERLGFTNYALFFASQVYAQSEQKRFVRLLVAHPQIAWVGSLAGEYHFGFAFLAQSPYEFASFLRATSESFHEFFTGKSLAPRVCWRRLSRKYLSTDASARARESIEVSGSGLERVRLDDLEHEILKIGANRDIESTGEIARTLGEPKSTVERRVRKLLEIGVIAGTPYGVNTDALGVECYRVFVSTCHCSKSLGDAFFTFAKKHARTTYFLESIGSWDYEFGVEVETAQQLTSFCQELSELAPADIERVHVALEVEDYKLTFYPFEKRPG